MTALARVTVESIAAGGDGVAHVDGMAVFVPRTAPGDIVDIRVRAHGRFGRGDVARLVEESPERAAPPCPHYTGDRCGGCQLQHLSYPAQVGAKQRIIRDAFARIARRDVPLPEVVASPVQWAYRSKLTLTMRRERGAWTIGLHAAHDPARVFALRQCPITAPGVVAAWREVMAAASTLPAERELRGVVRLLGEDLAFLLEGGTRWDHWREFVRQCPSIHMVRWHPAHGAARILHDRRSGDAPAAAFEQVNVAAAGMLRDEVVARATRGAPATVIDAYAGTGATARRIAAAGPRVTAVESDHEAASFAAAHMPPGSRAIAARVEDVLPGLLPADVVVLNPPRAGVDRGVTDALERVPRKPDRVIYVSCDPATLARDVGRLTSWRVVFMRAFDLFPQTAHVETVCELEPVERAAA
jgi:23S rRNA (uracil1939-C5)-methyltransferase